MGENGDFLASYIQMTWFYVVSWRKGHPGYVLQNVYLNEKADMGVSFHILTVAKIKLGKGIVDGVTKGEQN